MSSLYEQSLHIIRQAQVATGAYIASPAFPTYGYCWLRDGSFIAHAMDKSGEYLSAEAFFRWAGKTIQMYSYKIENIHRKVMSGGSIGKDEVLHTRFTLDGEEVTTDNSWGNFQIDGYGTWLWALAEHVRLSGDNSLVKELSAPVEITLRYLELVWNIPSYDCWEENPEFLHPYSLATVYSGFDSIAWLIRSGILNTRATAVEELAGQVKEFILEYGVNERRLNKHISPGKANEPPRPVPQSGVDSSLIGISIPYNVLAPDDPIMLTTVQAIESDLHRPGGGVYRYRADVYYGGGEWLLLTAWLGWYYASAGKISQAESLRKWIESQADKDGALVEQVSDYILAPQHFEPWLSKWGPVAKPLVWSHAMYVILVNAIQESKR